MDDSRGNVMKVILFLIPPKVGIKNTLTIMISEKYINFGLIFLRK